MIRAAAATHEVMAEAAQTVLDAGADAADALVAGFFALAGATPAGLLAPTVAMLGGTGVGGRVFDGRALQPGRGAPRPRGFLEGAEIPLGAYVAVPRSVAAVALLHTYRGRTSFLTLARQGVLAAERAGAPARAQLIRRIGQSGVVALRSSELVAALLQVGGSVAGGALSAEDFELAIPADLEAAVTPLSERGRLLTLPPSLAAVPEGEDAAPLRSGAATTAAVVAVDARGVVGALGVHLAGERLAVPGFDLALGLHATPVLRGVPRVPPGSPRRAPFGLALALHEQVSAALAVGVASLLDPQEVGELLLGSSFDGLAVALRQRTAGAVAGVLSDGRAARVF